MFRGTHQCFTDNSLKNIGIYQQFMNNEGKIPACILRLAREIPTNEWGNPRNMRVYVDQD